MVSTQAIELEQKLRRWMRGTNGLLVAFSGGVDSSYLAFAANKYMGSAKVVAVTGISPSVSSHQLSIASNVAERHGIPHHTLDTNEFEDPRYKANDGKRCYFCKSELFSRIIELRDERYKGYMVADGTNYDDLGDYRPGMRAAEESGVESPLADVGMTKAVIRELSKQHGLETWDMPASPCLSSRVQVGVEVSPKRISLIEDGEAILRTAGFREFRLRVDRTSARIEISKEEMSETGYLNKINGLVDKIRNLGFESVEIAPEGYRMGSANAGVRVG